MAEEDRELRFGTGTVRLAGDGAVLQVRHPRTGRTVLLDDADPTDGAVHDPARRWGKGFCVVQAADGPRGLRWDRPDTVTWTEGGVELVHAWPEHGLRLDLGRRFDDHWTEHYSLINTGAEPVRIGSIGISTPWRDVYQSSADSLAGAVHAHVWPGGADSYVWAEPMDGAGPGLGLVLITGELWAYSVESRDAFTSSNIRGHLYLHPTDVARSPEAFGGQPEIVIEPGSSYDWSWRLSWYADRAALHADRTPVITLDAVVAEAGQAIPITTTATTLPELVEGQGTIGHSPSTGSGYEGMINSGGPGVVELRATRDGRTARASVFFHRPLREVVERRVAFIAERQVARERDDASAAAFVPYDRRSGLTTLPTVWRDWNDVRERVAMPLLLQQTRTLGWGDPARLDDLLDRHRAFVLDRVVAADGTVADDSRRAVHTRLYNFPWYARYLAAEHDRTGNAADLDLAAKIIERYYALGGQQFLAFGLGGIVTGLAEKLITAGDRDRADALRDSLIAHGRHFVEVATDLPSHEVNYEQSMVAPMLDLMINVHRLDPDAVPGPEIALRLPWLTAFAGDQPDARLRHIPIRHWDGYWFGVERHWGDVFPHYWTVLSAQVFLGLPEGIVPDRRRAELRDQGAAILRANLINFADDGWATCAFVYPSCVNGNPTHHADPLANDQDWALVYALDHPEAFPA
ncbi:hypothetical protein [Microlunatus sp. GCM10028923]|uniref:hypothetical protein n=1 Tax=Microlunatus sp. GCM10028923 TaxID=3273400 RepID=UPI003623D1E3